MPYDLGTVTAISSRALLEVERILRRLDDMYTEMGKHLPAPVEVSNQPPTYKHAQLSYTLMVFLKGAKAVSALHAAQLLLRTGHLQEVPVLLRVATDMVDDVILMWSTTPWKRTAAIGEEADQVRAYRSFFGDVLGDQSADRSARRRRPSMVPRRKIRAHLVRQDRTSTNPEQLQGALEGMHESLSQYVHGTYVTAMEMYYGGTGRIHTTGLLGDTDRLHERFIQIVQSVSSAIVCACLVAKSLHARNVEEQLITMQNELVSAFKLDPLRHPK